MESAGDANKDPSRESDETNKTLSSQVLEYYKKYSQNRELPKYFSGTVSTFKIEDWHIKRSHEFLPQHSTVAVNTEEIVQSAVQPECSSLTRPPLIGQDLYEPQVPEINVVSENFCVTSPASSIASNRKLEWDNGADIGYSNVDAHKVLHKSLSLPVLSNLEYGELRKGLLRLSPEGNTTETPKVQQLKQSSSDSDSLQFYTDIKPSAISFNPTYTSSTSESIKSSKKDYLISSSSSSAAYTQEKLFVSDSQSNSDVQEQFTKFIKGKVGLPLAESTPICKLDQNDDVHIEKQKSKRNNSKDNLNNVVVSVKKTEQKENLNLMERSSSCENLNLSKIDNLKKWHSQIDLNMVDQVSHYKNLKVLKLSTSKPIVIECVGTFDVVGQNKLIQTSLPRNSSIAVQTDLINLSEGHKVPSGVNKSSSKYVERQSIVYMYHSDTDKDGNTHSCSATQTNSDALSKCHSFEYLYGTDYNQQFQQPQVEVEDQNREHNAGPSVIDRILSGNLKRCPPKSDLTTVTPNSDTTLPKSDSSASTSKESPLANFICSKSTGNLVPDLEKNLQLLQKVIKSRKYDDITKKYCLKKIIQKMVDSKYIDDSFESQNSDNDTKSVTTSSQNDSCKPEQEPIEITLKRNSTDEGKMNLHDNKPWLPIQPICNEFAQSNTVELPTRKHELHQKTLQTQTFINEILPEKILCEPAFVPYQGKSFVPIQVVNDDRNRLQRNPLFTLTDRFSLLPENRVEVNLHGSGDSSNSTSNELYEALPPPASEAATPLRLSTGSSNLKQTESKSKDFHSWREDKTLSEKLLEKQADEGSRGIITPVQEGSKDHLVCFAKKERAHQLHWISNEISHLSKLKKMLEQKQQPKNTEVKKILHSIVEKPRIEDMKDRKKSTTVYIVTTERSGSSRCSPHDGCHPQTCTNIQCQGRYVRSVPISSTGESSRNSRTYSSETQPNQATCCKCRKLPCVCELQIQNRIIKPPSLIGVGEKIVSIENETIDLKNARLVSSEQFTTGSNGANRLTSIRRYTFEVPIECTEKTLIENKIQQNNQPVCCPTICAPVCSPASSPKNNRRLTHELVITGEIIGNEESQPTSSRAKTPLNMSTPHICEVLPKEKCLKFCLNNTCQCDKITQTCCLFNCNNKCCNNNASCPCHRTTEMPSAVVNAKTQTSSVTSSSSSSSSSASESDVTSEKSRMQLCRCCKIQSEGMLKAEMQPNNKRIYYLCHPCYNQNRTNACYTYPGHVCKCYNITPPSAVQEMQKTIKELDDLEREEEICRCVQRRDQSASGYCSNCKCKLGNKIKSGKGGLTYTLTLEPKEEKPKKHKTKSSPRGKHKHRKSSDTSSDISGQSKENLSRHSPHKKGKHHKNKSTLQEYLCENKPNFIASAEQRRQCLLDLAYMREKRCQKYKQLLALTSGIPVQASNNGTSIKKQHVFSPKEMKEITAKNYKKLPEVQQKLVDNKEKQIKKANKLLGDIFSLQLRQQVLKGKPTIPPDSSIIKLS